MARVKYREHLAMVEAIQYDGTNLATLEEFAPGEFYVGPSEILFIKTPAGSMQVNVTDWVIDDPYIGYTSVITDQAFQARFDPTPHP
jgi:hypothetical protein